MFSKNKDSPSDKSIVISLSVWAPQPDQLSKVPVTETKPQSSTPSISNVTSYVSDVPPPPSPEQVSSQLPAQ